MTTYKESGVNIDAGDRASASAYAQAVKTFASRAGIIGAAVQEDDGFGGMLDMGDHYLVLSSDGTGSKMSLALAMNTYDTLGYDLTAMVADDMVCTGAETIALTNTFDVPAVYPMVIEGFMKGLADACAGQKIVIPAGEIAEVPNAAKEAVWNATAIGLVAKDRVLDPSSIAPGDVVLALGDPVARSNGFSLIRHILEKEKGKEWFATEWRDGKTWGEVFLTPSVVYSAALLKLLGRFGEERPVPVKGLSHITGGGIPSKFGRTLRASGYGARLHDLFLPHEALREVITLGSVPMEEAYRTWHMGQGMLVILAEENVEKALSLLAEEKIEAKKAGMVIEEPIIHIASYDGGEVTSEIRR